MPSRPSLFLAGSGEPVVAVDGFEQAVEHASASADELGERVELLAADVSAPGLASGSWSGADAR